MSLSYSLILILFLVNGEAACLSFLVLHLVVTDEIQRKSTQCGVVQSATDTLDTRYSGWAWLDPDRTLKIP